MNCVSKTLSALAVTAVLLGTTDSANAQIGYGLYGFARPWGFYSNTIIDQHPPYFAQYPPVYYKHPIQARQYGQSPFPYPACGCNGESKVVEPVTIRNPYVQSPKADSSDMKEAAVKSDTGAPQPVIIRNPYVDRSAKNDGPSTPRAAQTVYPTTSFTSAR